MKLVPTGTVQLDASDAAYLASALGMLPDLLARTSRQPTPKLLAAIATFTKTTAAAVEAARNVSRTDSATATCAAAQPDPVDAGPHAHATVTTAAAARILGTSPSAVRQLAQRGRLPARRPAGRWLYDAAAVVAYAEQRPARPRPSG